MRILLILFWMLWLTPVAYAFPDHPLTLVTPYPPTGSPDIEGTSRITRLIKTMQRFSTPPLTDSLAQDIAQLLAGALSQPVNIERHPKGNTITGARHVADAKPDGYTLLFAGSPTITIYPVLYPDAAFNPHKDLEPVAAIVRMPIALITAGDNPAKTVRDLIHRARLQPGRLNYAVIGGGSTSHLAGGLFRTRSEIDIASVEYNGSTPAINAAMTKDVDFGFVPLTAVLPFLKSGSVRIIAVASSVRHASVPGVPTIAESGLSGFDADSWFGIFAPAGTPGAIVSLLNDTINQALSEPFLQRLLIKRGLAVETGTPAYFRALIARDSARWSRLLKTSAIHP